MKDVRVVVGVDGSAEAREAARWAGRLAGVLDGEVVAVHALGLLDRLDGELIVAHAHREEIGQVLELEWCRQLRAGGTRVRPVVEEGAPVDVLLNVAEDEDASVIVVGARGGGSAPLFELGRTSLGLLQTTRVPVLVVPGRSSSVGHVGMRRILVGAESGSGASDAGLALACRLAGAFGAWVTVVEAVDTLAEAGTERRAPAIRRALAECGVPTHVAVRQGSLDEVVRSEAAAIGADLVVTGRRRAARGDLPAGSVGRNLVQALDRPTLVVPEDYRPAARVLPGLLERA